MTVLFFAILAMIISEVLCNNKNVFYDTSIEVYFNLIDLYFILTGFLYFMLYK